MESTDGGMCLSHAEEVPVRGHSATIVGGGTGPWQLFWAEDPGGQLVVYASGLDRQSLLATAESFRLEDRPRWPRRVVSAAGFQLVGGGVLSRTPGEGGWQRIVQWKGTGEGSHRRLQLIYGPGHPLDEREAAVEELARGEKRIYVRGRPAGLFDLGDTGPLHGTHVRWQEGPGQWAILTGTGLDAAEVIAAAESVVAEDGAIPPSTRAGSRASRTR